MGKIVGRSDDMLIIRGVNVFPTQIEEIVLAHEKLSGQYLIKVSREGHLDSVEVRCELQQAAAGIPDSECDEIAQWVQQRVKTLVGISTTVLVQPPATLERTLTGKARRVVDERPKT
jgi:phenylacetate-CoA ligase